MNRIQPIAPVKSVMYHSPDPRHIYTYSPGICALPDGRLVGTLDLGGDGVKDFCSKSSPLPGYDYPYNVCGYIFVSDDQGASWRRTGEFPFLHARPFLANGVLYVLGHRGDLMVTRSDDNGETWSEAVPLTHGEQWHQAPSNVCYVGDRVYLVMENIPQGKNTGWPVRALRPVVLRADVHDDLTKRGSWTFSDSYEFQELMQYDKTDYFGLPFYTLNRDEGADVAGRYCAPLGWLETNIVHIEDKRHMWYDPSGHSFILFMRAHTGLTNYCCVSRVVEKDDGLMAMEPIKVPSGKTLLYLPMPGGQMKFHILFDKISNMYWLLSTQSTDSMIKPECIPADRHSLSDNERNRLQLHFSKNCVDWCFAGLVDMGNTELESRHYASMCVSGDNLYILSRSCDEQALDPHESDMITLHEVRNFRELIY